MTNGNEPGIAAWLRSHAGIALPPERLPGYAQATGAACAGVAAGTAKLEMEDEPASYVAALVRLAEAKP